MIKAIALLTPIYVSIFWSLVFLLQRGDNNRSKSHLGIFMLAAFLLYCSHAIFFSQLYILYSYFESVYLFSMLTIYPLYYIYVLMRTSEKAGIRTQYKHFIPSLFFSVLSLISTILLSPEQRVFYVQEILIEKNLGGINLTTLVGIKGYIFFFARLILLVQVVYYSFKGIIQVQNHNKMVANYYSNLEGRTLDWIRNLNIVILFVAIASISFIFIGRSYFTRNEVSLIIPSLIFSSVLFHIGFKGSQHTETIEPNIKDNGFSPDFEKIKAENEDTLKKQLVELFELKKIYKYPDLRITNVSEYVGTNRTYISRLINDEFNMNFNEFVNSYRIDEAKRLLASKDYESYSIEHIAEKAGFGSSASFARVFKDLEGITPGKYRTKNNGQN